MPCDFVNQSRQAREIRREAKVVHRHRFGHAHQAVDHAAATIRPGKIEGMRVCKQPFEGRGTIEDSDRWLRRIEFGIARDAVDASEDPRLSGPGDACRARLTRQGADRRLIDTRREGQGDRDRPVVVHPKHDGVIGPVHGVPTRQAPRE